MKILHTGDLHLGMHPDRGMPWSEERHNAIWQAFRRIIQIANEEQVDLLLIAGDIFHRQPLLRDLKEVNALFQTLTTAYVVMIAGNHDHISSRSPYPSFPWAGHVIMLTEEQLVSVYIEELNTEIHGFSYHQAEITQPQYDALQAPDDGRIHILLGHGGDEKHIPIQKSKLAAAGFHYAALGHIHKPELYEELRLAWCGSPEPIDRTDIGPRGYILAEVSPAATKLQWHPLCTAQYIPLTVTITPDSTREGLADTLRRTAAEKGLQHIYSVTLQGQRSADMDFSQPMDCGIRMVHWEDQTTAALDYDQIYAMHREDILGQFIEEISALPAGSLREQALAYGVMACLPEGGSL